MSPRLFEAAITRCGQILIEAPYLDALEPWVHYIPIDEKCKQAPEVLDRMQVHVPMKRMIDAFNETLIGSSRYALNPETDP